MGKKRNDEYQVKDVLAYKRQGKIEYFLVWWQGYPKREATWEPVTNLEDVEGYDEYYKNLKQSYDNNLRKKGKSAKLAHKTQRKLQTLVEESQSEEQSKSKKIHKAARELRSNSKKGNQQPRSVNQQEQMQMQEGSASQQEEIIEERSASPEIIQREDKKAGEEKARLKRLLNSAPAVKFQIKIKQFKQLPFLGQKIKQIKQAFTRNGKTMYEVQLADSKAMTQPVILHQNFIKVLWPKQFASYLLSKQRK